MTRRGKVIIGVVTVLVLGLGTVVVMAAFGRGPDAVQDILDPVLGDPSPEPLPCPLTGELPESGTVPSRAALVVKVENDPSIRPQDGLDTADIVYEQEVEGGITRFMVVYHCSDAKRIWPIRSARTSDPAVLTQFGTTAFAYADAANYVVGAVKRAAGQTGKIVDIRWEVERGAYTEDPAREAPHQLYSSTKALYKAAGKKVANAGPPRQIFGYSTEFPDVKSKVGKKATLPFSDFADVEWRYRGGVYERYDSGQAHESGGSVITADNVLVQLIDYKPNGAKDVVGNPVLEAQHVGTGKAYLLRDGKVIALKWERENAKGGVTLFTTKTGERELFKPGNTWVELYPTSAPKPKF